MKGRLIRNSLEKMDIREGTTTNASQITITTNHCQPEKLLTKNPRRWNLGDMTGFARYLASLPPDEQEMIIADHEKKWNLPISRLKSVSREQYDHATGFYVGSAYDEMGLTSEARCVYSHLVRRASLSGEQDKLWRQGKFKRTAKCGVRDIAQWCGLSHATVTKATKELEDVRLVTVKRKSRKPHICTLEPPSVWCTWLRIDPSVRK